MNYNLSKLLRISKICMGLSIYFTTTIAAEPYSAPTETVEEQIDINKVSEGFGHILGKNIQTIGLELNPTKVIKGLQDSMAGLESPMNETDCIQAISLIQEKSFQKQSQSNLQTAEEFLVANSKKSGVVELEPNKLQYKIEQTGSGETVKPHCTPTIRYTGRFSDGNVFGASKEGEAISLDETIPGFTRAIIGMREGEKRTVYIHPELGYGTSGYLPPNSLLTFEIEIVKADTPVSDLKQESNNDEIAEAILSPAAIR